MGVISSSGQDAERLYAKVKDHTGIDGVDLVKFVTTDKHYRWTEKVWKWDQGAGKNAVVSNHDPQSQTPAVVVYDFGVKLNILRNLAEAGFDITVVPAQTPAEEVLDMDPDGIVLGNGPGDPQAVTYGIENTKKLIGKKPVFGICLGHQIIGLALGGSTYKLKFGHHGGNHPVKDLATGRVEITSQNHNYCVDLNSLGDTVRLTHKNLYDGTEEGMEHVEYPLFSVQHHPEAGPGPNDSCHIFERFRNLIEKGYS
jgi:carbamoyl-phosphate synthase small subunit